MQYFAGLFDAEGYVSLCPNGAFTIAFEMSNEEIPNLFKEKFEGSVYTRKRDDRKKTWTWKINSISSQSLNFINSIVDFSIVKKTQLLRLRDYLDQPRDDRKHIRAITCSTLKNLKQPMPITKEQITYSQKPIEPYFFEWLAGFIDGDGNFVCNEYTYKKSGLKYFDHQISVANIFPEAICYINDRIPGCITDLHRSKNPLFKWTCNRHNEKFLIESILPFMKIKKGQCELFLEFITFPLKTRNVPRPIEERERMYEIIKQIKHLNSL
jgi:hypothetical protein